MDMYRTISVLLMNSDMTHITL